MKKFFGFGAMIFAFVAASLTVSASPIGATLSYNLTDDHCTGGCGTSPFGTITLTQTDAKNVKVSVTITAGFFVTTGGPHETFAFSIASAPAINITGISNAKFTVDSGFGGATYNYGFNGPGPGGSDLCCSTFSFNVALVSGNNLDITSFGPNFEADMYSSQTGNTGEVSGNGGCVSGTVCGSQTPEPISSALVGSGLISLFFLRRRATK